MTELLLNQQERGKSRYAYPIAILMGLLFGLLIFQGISRPKIALMAVGPAMVWAFLPLALACACGFFFPRSGLTRFLSGIPFAIVAVSLTSVGALAGTLVLQNPSADDAQKLGSALPFLQRFGLTDVFHSVWFGGMVLALILCLGVSVGRRLRPFTLKNVVFSCTHLGMAVVLAGGVFSNLTALSGMIALEVDQPNQRLQGEDGKPLFLPGPLTLKAFAVDPFPLEVCLGKASSVSATQKRGGRSLPFLEPGKHLHLHGWDIECLETFPSADLESRIVPHPNGSPAIDLVLHSHGTETRMPMMARSGIMALPSGVMTGVLDASSGRMEEALTQARANWGKDQQPGVLYVSDGKQWVALKRDLEGKLTEFMGLDALKPISFGKMALSVDRHYLAVAETHYKPAEGLRQNPIGAAHILAKKGNETRDAWIAAGPTGAEWLKLEGDTVLMLVPPQPKTFRSEILVEGQTYGIRVNHPLTYDGWQLTQTSWQVDGQGNPVSVLRAMKDPSIPIVWTGLWMLMLGTLGALWILPALLSAKADEGAK